MRSPYEILGISEGATPAEASRAYRRLALRYHPDRFVGRPASEVAAAQGAFVEVQLAYEEVQARMRSGQTRTGTRSSTDTRPRRTERTSAPPGPTAIQIVEHEVAQVLNNAARKRREAGLPWAFLAQRVARGVIASMGDVSWLRISSRSDADRAGLGFAAFILRPPSSELFDETMVEFSSRVALLCLRRLGPSLTDATRAALWAKVPDVVRSSLSFKEPTFCHVCLVAPARHLDFQVLIGTLFWHRTQHLSAYRCADCAEPLFRDVQSAQLRSGWWSPSSFVLTPLQLRRNHQIIKRARLASAPTRPRELAVAPMTPPSSSRWASWLSPALAALILVWLVSRFFVGISSHHGTSAATSHRATAVTTSTAPPASKVASTGTAASEVPSRLPRLAADWSQPLRPGRPNFMIGEVGPMVWSAGARVHTFTYISLHKDLVDGSTLNFPDHTTEAQARWLVAAALPADATTTSSKVIKSYDNSRDLLVGDCVAWTLRSRSMAEAFAARGVTRQQVVFVGLYSSKPTDAPSPAKKLSAKDRALLKTLNITPSSNDNAYDPADVTSAMVFATVPPKPTNECWTPDPPDPPRTWAD